MRRRLIGAALLAGLVLALAGCGTPKKSTSASVPATTVTTVVTTAPPPPTTTAPVAAPCGAARSCPSSRTRWTEPRPS